MRESAGSGIREISDAEGRPPAPTSEGIQAEFYLSFRDAWASVSVGEALGLFFWERELDCGRSDRLHLAFPLPCLTLWRSEGWRRNWGPEGLGKSGSRRRCLEGWGDSGARERREGTGQLEGTAKRRAGVKPLFEFTI